MLIKSQDFTDAVCIIVIICPVIWEVWVSPTSACTCCSEFSFHFSGSLCLLQWSKCFARRENASPTDVRSTKGVACLKDLPERFSVSLVYDQPRPLVGKSSLKGNNLV